MTPRRRDGLRFVIRLLCTVGFLGLFAAVAPRLSAQHEGDVPTVAGSLRGQVTHAEGAPLANLQVLLYDFRQPHVIAQTTTDAAGYYAFRALGPATYKVEARDPTGTVGYGYYANAGRPARFADATPVVVMGDDVSGIDIRLPNAGQITGEIAPVAGYTATQVVATVYRDVGDGRWAEWQTQVWPTLPVSFTFAGLVTNDYRLCVSAYGPVEPYEAAYGYVVIQFAECYPDQLPTQVNEYPPFPLLLETAGGGPSSPPHPNGGNIVVTTGAATTVTVGLGDVSQLQGRAVDEQGNPLRGVTVEARGEAGEHVRWVQTDTDGDFQFGYLPADAYRILYQDLEYQYVGGYHPQRAPSADAQRLTINSATRITGLELPLIEGATITGKLRVAGNEPPAVFQLSLTRFVSENYSEGITIVSENPAEARHGLQYTPATGDYSLPGLLPGEYIIQAFGYLSNNNTVTGEYVSPPNNRLMITKGATINNVNITLGVGQLESSITGVVMADGKPTANIEVGLYEAYRGDVPLLPLATTTTDAQGRYTLRNLSEGPYKVRFRDPDGLYATSFYTGHVTSHLAPTLQLPQDATLTDINGTLQWAGALSGRVRLRSGEAAQDYQMVLYRQMGANWELLTHVDVRTDVQGRYALRHLLPGIYRVGAIPPAETLSQNSWTCPEPLRYAVNCYENIPYNSTPYFFPLGRGIHTGANIHVGRGTTSDGYDFVVDPAALYLPLVNLTRPSTLRQNLMATLTAAGQFSTLIRVLTATGLDSTLGGEGPFTLLAPNDAAFAALPAGALDQLLQNPTGQLTQILLFHLLPDRVISLDIQHGMQVSTFQGEPVTFEVSGRAIRVDGANIVYADLDATNGVIHVLDAVILPPLD